MARIDSDDDGEIIPLHALPGEPRNARQAGACTCACRVRTGPDGRARRDLEADPTACTCDRIVGVRVNEHGDLREVTEPCSAADAAKERATMSTKTTRADADDLRLELARATALARANTMWRADATPRRRVAGTLGRAGDDRVVPIVASTPGDPGDGVAVSTWDLERYRKNPVVLWAHDDRGLPIRTAEAIEPMPDGTLKVRVRLASAAANPLAETIYQAIREGIVRAVSVRFEDLGNGVAELREVSFVPIGLDEDAGTADVNPAAASDAEHKRYFEEDVRKQHGERADADDDGVARARAERDRRMANLWRS